MCIPEASHFYFPLTNLGAWYRGDEIGRRGGVFYVGLTLGTLTAALIQSGASSQLDGVHGLAGWRWMYIICSIITIPVGILGFFVIPGTPDKPNRLVVNEKDLKLAKDRLLRAGHKVGGKVTFQTFVKVAKSKQIWGLLLLDIFFWNGCINTSSGGYLLWLKSLKRYTPARVNSLGAISPALGIFYTLGICFASDLIVGPAWAITISHIWNIIGLIILTIWNVPEAAKWFAFMTTYSAVAMSSVLYGWINSQLSYSQAERSVALVFANLLAQSTTAWTPLLVFKTVEAPRFKKGWPFVLANAVCLIITAHVIAHYVKRRKAYVSESSHPLNTNFKKEHQRTAPIAKVSRTLLTKCRPTFPMRRQCQLLNDQRTRIDVGRKAVQLSCSILRRAPQSNYEVKATSPVYI